MATKWQRTRIQIPPTLKPVERQEIALEIIDFIANRSKRGLDKDGGKFVRYTKQYAKSKGTSRTNVDLTLDGELLNELKLISHKNGSLLIGYDRGSKVNAKADGNIRGTYGKPSPIPGKARPFLGIDQDALNDILDDFISER